MTESLLCDYFYEPIADKATLLGVRLRHIESRRVRGEPVDDVSLTLHVFTIALNASIGSKKDDVSRVLVRGPAQG